MIKFMKAAAAVLMGTLTLTACANDNATGGDGGLSGTIEIDGSSTVFPITEAVAEEFNIANPGVDVTVGVSGTGGGFEKFCAGETDFSDASRPIKDEEAAICAAAGIEYVELTVATDGLAVMVNPANDWVECLTLEELTAIWEPGSKVTNWSQVRDGFPDRKLTLFGPGTDSGTFDYFTDEVNGEEGASRSDYTASEDDNTLVTGIAGDPNALGYFGYAYYQENTDKLKVLGVDSGSGCVAPSPETVLGGTYTPLARPIFIYAKVASLAKEEVAAFAQFYLDNTSVLAVEVGYVAPPEDALTANQVALDAAL